MERNLKDLKQLINKKTLIAQLPGLFDKKYKKKLDLGPGKLKTILKKTGEFEIDGEHVQPIASSTAAAGSAEPVPAALVSKQPATRTEISPQSICRLAHMIEKSDIDSEPHEGKGDLDQFNEFYQTRDVPGNSRSVDKHPVLMGERAYAMKTSDNAGFLGSIRGRTVSELESWDKHVFLNVDRPMCMVCVGVQGSGKSHTMNVVLENCLMECMEPPRMPLISLEQRLCGLVFHYDQNEASACEVVGLKFSRLALMPVRKMVVLVSPTYYLQRKRYYEDICEVRPLLFKWKSLGAQQLKKLMRLSEKDGQLYVNVMLNLLREYQRHEKVPDFMEFMDDVQKKCDVKSQGAPLQQRLQLLKSIIFESDDNGYLRQFHSGLGDILESGVLVVADLTDPMLSIDEANGIFQVLLEQFKKKDTGCGKVLACDEAHKYLHGQGPGTEELAAAIVDIFRVMRHDNIRVLISTQSPLTLPAELLELVSLMVLHQFQSADWYKFLSSKIDMPEGIFQEIKSLHPGEALLLASRTNLDVPGGDSLNSKHCIAVNIRNRVTRDLGESKSNKAVI